MTRLRLISRLRWFNKQRLIISALILAAFVLGYGVGRVPIIWHSGEHLVNQTAERLFAQAKIERPESVLVIEVDLRGYHVAADPQEYDTEMESYFFNERMRIPVNEAALILVDVWEEKSDNDGWDEREREINSTTLLDVLQAARENNMLIIHAPALGTISDVVSPLAGEIVLDSSNWMPDDKELHVLLLRHNVKTLFYVGYATNVCVLNRPYGIKRMHDLGYRTILVRDCTAALEYHDTLEEKWVTRMAVREVEKKEAGYSCTSRDFIEGFTE